jgi:hypothetical protein
LANGVTKDDWRQDFQRTASRMIRLCKNRGGSPGYTQAEIASMLSVPPGTVASWLSRAKAQLRETLTND